MPLPSLKPNCVLDRVGSITSEIRIFKNCREDFVHSDEPNADSPGGNICLQAARNPDTRGGSSARRVGGRSELVDRNLANLNPAAAPPRRANRDDWLVTSNADAAIKKWTGM